MTNRTYRIPAVASLTALFSTLFAGTTTSLPAQESAGARSQVVERADRAIPSSPASATAPFEVRVYGAGRPVLLIPGLISGGGVWDDVVERWRGDHELHVFTLAGFAGVPAIDGDRFLETERDAVIEYIRERKLERPVIVGHSLGAFLGFSIASSAPDLLGGLVAVDGVPFLVALGDSTLTEESMSAQAEAMRRMYASMTAEQMAMQSRMSLLGMMKDTMNISRGVEWARTSDPATAGAAVAEMVTTDLRTSVRAITVPVLLIAAGGAAQNDEQRTQLLARYEAQVRGIPAARVVLASNAYHFVMLDDPEFFHSIVDPFLADALAAATGVPVSPGTVAHDE